MAKTIINSNSTSQISTYSYKLKYISALLKISHKQFESYVIHRIWHRLNDTSVLFIPQQHVGISSNRYLIDLYLPQINLAIEVNEAYHKNSQQALNDKQRRKEIHEATGINFAVIECYDKSLKEVNRDVDKLVRIIRLKILLKRLTFKYDPWTGKNQFKVSYYKSKKHITAAPFRNYALTTTDIAAIFNATFKKRGFLSPGAAQLPNDPNTIVWWPSVNNSSGWINTINDDETEIIESNSNPKVNQEHFNEFTNPPTNQKRITWFKEKNILGFDYYHFVGVFEIDIQKSISLNTTVWRRTSDKVNIP